MQYATGLRVDLIRLSEACRRNKSLFCIDAIQSLGAMQFDVQTIQPDFIVADGHKWMLGPEGLALFYVSPSAREILKPTQFGWHMVEDYLNFDNKDWSPANNARRYECGSPNMLCIHALDASLSLFEALGTAYIEQRVLENSRYLFDSLQAIPEIELVTRNEPNRFAGIVTFRSSRKPADRLYQQLRDAGILCAMRGGGVRFSPHFYMDKTQLQRACDAVSV